MSELVLVTGASGYIATHVVKRLIQAGYKVRGTVRSLKNEAKVRPIRALGVGGDLELVEADLMDPDCWAAAVEGCTYVQHVASPFPDKQPSDENELIKPAVSGTLNVLKACRAAKTIKRVVVTSSGAAVFGNDATRKSGQTFSEADWTDLTRDVDPYQKSKTLAEKAAWDYVADLPEDEKFELAVGNPTWVVGPPLCGASGTSMKIVQQVLERQMSAVPAIHMPAVDVRDVAAGLIACMTLPEAAGQRHLFATESIWFKDVGAILAKEFKPMGYNPPTSEAPYWLLWIVGRFNKLVRAMLPMVGKEIYIDNTRFTKVLKINPRPLDAAFVEMAYGMINSGKAQKKSGYKPRGS